MRPVAFRPWIGQHADGLWRHCKAQRGQATCNPGRRPSPQSEMERTHVRCYPRDVASDVSRIIPPTPARLLSRARIFLSASERKHLGRGANLPVCRLSGPPASHRTCDQRCPFPPLASRGRQVPISQAHNGGDTFPDRDQAHGLCGPRITGQDKKRSEATALRKLTRGPRRGERSHWPCPAESAWRREGLGQCLRDGALCSLACIGTMEDARD